MAEFEQHRLTVKSPEQPEKRQRRETDRTERLVEKRRRAEDNILRH